MSHAVPRLVSIALLAGLLLSAISAPGGSAASPTGPQTMPPHPRLDEQIKAGLVRAPQTDLRIEGGGPLSAESSAPAALTGHLRALAVLVDFSDKVHTVQASYFDTLIFAAPQAGRGSVNDYYNDVSYGQVDIVSVNLPSSLGWRRAPQTIAYYANGNNCLGLYPRNCQKLAEDVVDAINGVVNFANYDNNGDGQMEPIMIIHAGRGAEYTGSKNDIWSHSWGLAVPRTYDGVRISKYVTMPEYWATVSPSASDMTIGVFAHEMGHGFWGLPDLYDTDYSSEGIGNWSLMAGGSWNGPGGLGGSPAWPDAYSRILMGYVAPTTPASDVQGQSIPQAASTSGANTIFKLKNSVLASQEYFLVENREKTLGSYDEYLPGSGLAIWHVDQAKSGNSTECTLVPHSACGSAHYLVALEQADGLRELEFGTNRGTAGDVFSANSGKTTWNGTTNPESSSWYTPAATNIAVTGISAAGASMTANLLLGSGTPLPPTIRISDVSVNEGDSGTVPANFTVSLSAPASGTVSVGWATQNGTAAAGSDYVAGSGTVTFAPGETSKTVPVTVNGDTAVEGNETFNVNLSNAMGATIADGLGVGTILNDDQVQATVHLGGLTGSKTTSKKNWTVKVTITVHDGSHRLVSGAVVTGSWSSGGSPVTCTTNRSGVCTVSVTLGPTVPSVTFTVTTLAKTGSTYVPAENDVDTMIMITK